ncbi:MAG: IS110 family transposase [Gammaproteobacteria bacterium]|nr:IS110 family transposase [Gammaproteobacteria bacterium]
MKLYGGIDLHSTNSYMVLIDEAGRINYKKRLLNDMDVIRKELGEFEGIDSLVVESTYNWYWLGDGLMDEGYKVKLANPNAIKQYDGIKHTNDKTDARWLADLNRLGILNAGYIYPKESRSVRDLLRKRSQLVQHRTTHILSMQTLIERTTAMRLSANQIKQLTEEKLSEYLKDVHIYLAAKSNLLMSKLLDQQIKEVEKVVYNKIKLTQEYKKLCTVDGIGKILSLTIMLETGEISRFAQVGNYSSYCRLVDSERKSNGKKKGENNKKNGNKYLCWAYIEAANFAIRNNEVIKRYYQRKCKKTNRIVAIKTIAHKLARACYYIIRDGVDFDVNKSFT